jgi:NTE family protein
MFNYENLVFEGGGVKGIAYVGALGELRKDIDFAKIKRIGGASAGAITALLVGLNYNQQETEKLLKEMDFNEFKDDSFGAVRDVGRFLYRFGVHKGDVFHTWARDAIEKKTKSKDTTFGELKQMSHTDGFKDMYFIATNVSTGYSEVFSHETTPGMKIADAVRASMSIPFFFTPIILKRASDGSYSESDDGHVYVDGGLINNFPVRLFDKNKYIAGITGDLAVDESYSVNEKTIGLRLEESTDIDIFKNPDAVKPIKYNTGNIVSYILAISGIALNQQDSTHMESNDSKRTIYIDSVGVRTTDFDLPSDKKQALIKSGENSVKSFFANLLAKTSPITTNPVFGRFPPSASSSTTNSNTTSSFTPTS